MRVFFAAVLLAAVAFGQQAPANSQPSAAIPVLTDPNAPPAPPPTVHTLPASAPDSDAYKLDAGTHIAVTLKHAITTRTAHENDPVYAETSFPVVANGRIVIPVGTYVQGVIQRSVRPGRIKGRGELVIHFNTLIFPSGYTLLLPGALNSVPGADQTKMKEGSEGTVESQGTKEKDAGTVAKTTAAGATVGSTVGAVTNGSAIRGAAIGAGAGAAVGLATVLLTRGPDVRIESGMLVDMVLEREIIVEHARAASQEPAAVRIVH
jgi:type IV secretion system protein VirB10